MMSEREDCHGRKCTTEPHTGIFRQASTRMKGNKTPIRGETTKET